MQQQQLLGAEKLRLFAYRAQNSIALEIPTVPKFVEVDVVVVGFTRIFWLVKERQRRDREREKKTKKKKIQHRNYRVLDIILLSAQKIITALTFRIDHLQEKAVIFGIIKPFGCQETPLFLSQT